MKYSIVINNYNKENYIKRCLDSIINQDFKDYELIIVDDHSTDSSIDIIKSYNIDYKLIINEWNYGLSISRNIGVDAVSGDYVLFVDSDDCLQSDSVLTKLDNICNKDSFNHILYIYNRVRYTSKCKYFDTVKLNSECECNSIDLLRLSNPVFRTQTNKLYNRKFLPDNEIRNVPFRCYTQDVLFNILVYSYLHYYDLSAYNTNIDGYHYNSWLDNTTCSIDRSIRISTFIKGAEFLIDKYKDSKISEIICPVLNKLINEFKEAINV